MAADDHDPRYRRIYIMSSIYIVYLLNAWSICFEWVPKGKKRKG